MYQMNCNKCYQKWHAKEIETTCPNCKATGPIVVGFKFTGQEPEPSSLGTGPSALGTAAAETNLQPKSAVEVAMERAKMGPEAAFAAAQAKDHTLNTM